MSDRVQNLMRLALFGFAVLVGLLCPGCQEQQPVVQPASIDNRLIHAALDSQIEAAIVVQHTLYPYHFANGTARLNELGLSDLAVLTRHAEDNSSVNVRKGDAGDELYKARVQTVADAIAKADAKGMSVAADQMPGGDGMSSDRAARLLEQAASPPTGGQAAPPSSGQPTPPSPNNGQGAGK